MAYLTCSNESLSHAEKSPEKEQVFVAWFARNY